MAAVRMLALAVAVSAVLAGCDAGDADGASQGDPGAVSQTPGGEPDPQPSPRGSPQRYPDVIDVTVKQTGDTFTFSVTISSPYDSPDRYADGWRVIGADGTVYGEHTLAHDHANEQPFTRTQAGVRIPAAVREVTVQGRDSQYGYGGGTMTVTLP